MASLDDFSLKAAVKSEPLSYGLLAMSVAVWWLGPFSLIALAAVVARSIKAQFGAYRNSTLWLLLAPLGRRLFVSLWALLALRDAWYALTRGGTFHDLVFRLVALFERPRPTAPDETGALTEPLAAPTAPAADIPPFKGLAVDVVTDSSLSSFQRLLEGLDRADWTGAPCRGRWVALDGEKWEEICYQANGTLTYTAWRQLLPNGKTRYLTRTVVEAASPRLMNAFYNDDAHRLTWDDMFTSYEVLEADPITGMDVSRWVRRFPVFCAPRDYIISRRSWALQPGQEYATVTTGCTHPDWPSRAAVKPRRVDVYFSSWRCRAVPGRMPGASPACETVLVHHEEMGIQEDLARIAIRRGMWGLMLRLEPGYRTYAAKVTAEGDGDGTQITGGQPRLMGTGQSGGGDGRPVAAAGAAIAGPRLAAGARAATASSGRTRGLLLGGLAVAATGIAVKLMKPRKSKRA